MPYITPATIPAGVRRKVLHVPADVQYLALVTGALLELTRVQNFERVDGITPEEAAAQFTQMLYAYLDEDYQNAMPEIGEVKMFAYDRPEADGWLTCDGRLVSRTAYAALFAVIGTTHGSGDSATFRLPRGVDRYVLGQAVDGYGDPAGGFNRIQISQANLPADTVTSNPGGTGVTPASAGTFKLQKKGTPASFIDHYPEYVRFKLMIFAGTP